MTTFVLAMLMCEKREEIICVHKAETQQFEAVDLMLSIVEKNDTSSAIIDN